MIKKYYYSLKPDNFVYFLQEKEFRFNTSYKNKYSQIKELKSILEYSLDTCNWILWNWRIKWF